MNKGIELISREHKRTQKLLCTAYDCGEMFFNLCPQKYPMITKEHQ